MLVRRLLLCLNIVLVTIITACGRGEDRQTSSESGLNRVVQTRALRAAYINYPPSFTVDPNTKAKGGIMNDVMSMAARNLGLKLDYVEETTWATMIDALEARRADVVVSGIWPSSARALRADFSRAVYFSPVYGYARSDDHRFDGDLQSANDPRVRLATIDGELSSIVAKSDFPNARVVSLPQQTDISQLLLQLSSGKADLTFVESAVANEYLAKNPGSVRQIAQVPPVRIFANTFLFRQGDTGLRDAVNIAIVELENSGQVARIMKKYDPTGNQFVVPETPLSP